MRRANPRRIGSVCHFCAFVPAAQATKQPFLTHSVLSQARHARGSSGIRPAGVRWLSTPGNSAAAAAEQNQAMGSSAPAPAKAPAPPANPAHLVAMVEEASDKFLSAEGIPSIQQTGAALQTCLRAAEALQPHIRKAEAKAKASTTRLEALGKERTGTRLTMDTQIMESVNKISYAAYGIISSPNVELKPEVLELYVVIQATLGRPESLPSVLELYATKPKPTVKSGVVRYVKQNPNKAIKAIEEGTATMALQTAIDAKNLDAALGIVEASFALPAFRRQKMLKHSTAPALGVASMPFGIFGAASLYAAYWQNTMDISTATSIGCLGISGYLVVVGSLGLIAKLSHKEHMKRVTWAPGTPLRTRWLREEERRAMDKIALAWGFKEPWRWGEESGAEWEGMKEYMGYRQMLLDRVEFMEGMG